MIGIFNEHLTLNVDDEHMLNIVERPGGFWVEILEKNFHTIVAITTEMATELAEWINNHQGNQDKQHSPTIGTKKNMKIDNPKGRAWWEWVRTANPWLPPYEKLDPAQIRADVFEVTLTVHLEHPSEPFRWDRWEEILVTRMHGSNWSWDECLRAAMKHLADAIHHQDKMHHDDYRPHLVETAARVRAMAPEGAEWRDPRPVVEGCGRQRLRHVLRMLIQADEDNGRYEGVVKDRLAEAEASLHGLWLAAVEEG